MTTKERICDEALRLFSERGYAAVGVEQIAAAVGIRAPSLYKHFKGKRDIFDAVFYKMQQRYDEQTGKMQLHIASAAQDTARFAAIDADGLAKQLRELIYYSLHDEYVSRVRRFMTIEQFRSPEFAALYTERYVDRLVGYHEKLFTTLMDVGAMRKDDPHILALQYTCPVLVLLGVCDREPEKEPRAMEQIEAHARQFFASTRPNKTN